MDRYIDPIDSTKQNANSGSAFYSTGTLAYIAPSLIAKESEKGKKKKKKKNEKPI